MSVTDKRPVLLKLARETIAAMISTGILEPSLTDQLEPSVLSAAVSWVQGALLGTIATTIAVIAIGSIGLMMLSGRSVPKRGATAIVGCFILFGASRIAAGLQAMATGSGEVTTTAISRGHVEATFPTPIAAPDRPPSQPYDPYAGAAVPPG
ncbi:MAG: TrbC/VirB2 family protein [Sphingomonas bacterium]